LYNNGNTISYSKEIGDIDFEEISFETFDAIIGTNQGEEGCVTIPFMSDKPINWVEGKWTDAYGNERKVKETLPEKTYNGFLRIPACEVHKGLVLVANLTTASWKDERSGDPDHNESCISKTVGDVPMLHAPRAFNAETVYDGKGSVLLTWRVDDMDQTDIIDGDAFQDKQAITLNDKDAGCIIISSTIPNIAEHMGTINKYSVNITPVIRLDIKEGRVRVTLTVQNYDVLADISGGWLSPKDSDKTYGDSKRKKEDMTNANLYDEQWEIAHHYPFVEKDKQKRTCAKAFVMTHAYTNAVLDKVEEAIKNGIIGNEDDDW